MNALTTNASRVFADQIEVAWAPSSTQSLLSVSIKVGGELYKALKFPGTSKQGFNVETPITKLNGEFAATFNAVGTSGELNSITFKWNLNGQEGYFNGGTIGLW